MPKNPLKLKVAYLYPDILQSFCDDANVETFVQRAKWRDIDVTVHNICANDKVQSARFDFYYIGGNNIDALNIVLPYIKQNEDELKVASMSAVPMLAVNSGYQVFGNYFQLHNSPKMEGLKILDVNSIANKKYFRGNIAGSCSFLNNRTIAGFESHGIATYLKDNVAPFLILQSGYGNNGKDKTEGARINNTIGTYISGPLLAQNPHLCDFFISNALRIKYKCRIPLTKLKDDIEWYSHNYILESK